MERIQKAVKSMEISEQKKKMILENSRNEAAGRCRRRKGTRMAGAAVAACLAVSGVFFAGALNRGETVTGFTVYAKEAEGMQKVDLTRESAVSLEKTETPLGEGYEIKVLLDEGWKYICAPSEESFGLETVFTQGDTLYWLPDGGWTDRAEICDENGEKLDWKPDTEPDSVDVMYSVFDEDDNLRYTVKLQLSRQDGEADLTILGVDSYPAESKTLDVITESDEISRIAEENPRVKEALLENEVLAEITDVTESREAEEIYRDDSDVETVLDQNDRSCLVFISGEGAKIRENPNIESKSVAEIGSNERIWAVLSGDYVIKDKFLWWEVLDSSRECSGWIAGDYLYLYPGEPEKGEVKVDMETFQYKTN